MAHRKTLGLCLPLAAALIAACGSDPIAPEGTLLITTVTAGAQSDSDGYTIAVDGAASRAIGPNATLRIADLAAGSHRVVLDGLAPNCALLDGATRDVEVEPGSEQPLEFRVTCLPSLGWLKIVTATSGEDLDTGYRALVDEGATFALGARDSANVPRLTTGDHDIRLTEVAFNCAVVGANPRRVTIAFEAETRLEFTVACTASAPPGPPDPGADHGTLIVTVRTTLILAPASLQFGVAVDGGPIRAIPANGSLTFAPVVQGSHTVRLSVASFCAVGGFGGSRTSTKTVNVPANGTVTAVFDVLCIG
jgi:hypothetical protein